MEIRARGTGYAATFYLTAEKRWEEPWIFKIVYQRVRKKSANLGGVTQGYLENAADEKIREKSKTNDSRTKRIDEA